MKGRGIFNSFAGVKNQAGGVAHNLSPKLALAQMATTSCLNNTLYVSAEKQLNDFQALAVQVALKPGGYEYIAKLAVYSRQKYYMKDMPALLCVILAAGGQTELLSKIFSKVINNGDMLRNFFQMIRSGQCGRRSFGSLPKRLMTNWFNSRTPSEIFDQSVGTPSMKDILRLIRPKPLDRTRSAMYAWLVDKSYDTSLLPEKIRAFEQWKEIGGEVPQVDFRMLTNQTLTTEQWTAIAKRAGWKWLLKNLNTMQKHGVLDQPGMEESVAERLRDANLIKKAHAFPYQILSAYKFALDMPIRIWRALHDAMEIATSNVPVLPESKSGNAPVWILMDISKSMTYPITGNRYGIGNRANSSMKCVDVAALIACSLLRYNKGADMICFNDKVQPFPCDLKASVMDNANAIGKVATGGTACSAPMKWLNEHEKVSDLVILLSDNQSWVESMNIDRYGKPVNKGATPFQQEWLKWKERNPQSKLVCIDVAPYTTTQVQERPDVLNLGGWSDHCFELIGSFARGEMNPDHVVGIVEAINLDGEAVSTLEQD